MKAIRTYELDPKENLLRMESFISPDEDSLELPIHTTITVSVSPDSTAPQAFFLTCTPETPLDLRLQEMQHIINVLKLMYYGV